MNLLIYLRYLGLIIFKFISHGMCSKMTTVFVVSATIFCLGLNISGSNCMESVNLIEIVEEWGCYDTEIRLTCGHLDSKIAILEATFTPNCTQAECIKGDLKRLMRGYSAARNGNSRSAETEAGRKFLETLRKSDKSWNGELVDAKDHKINAAALQVDQLVGPKEKRASLRVSLENLIVKYLRQISPSENFEEVGKRSARYRRELSPSLTTESDAQRVVIASRSISIEDRDHEWHDSDREWHDRAANSDERYRRIHDSRGFCLEQKRKIGSLGRLEIDEAVLRKDADVRQNIRKILNKRCSGKNYCSFLFAADDPLAVLWDSGVVHLKYICMDAYHGNHYCNEHFTIGNYYARKIRRENSQKGDPIAEARVNPRDHSFHSLKILKTNDDVEKIATDDENSSLERNSERLKSKKFKKKEHSIYSQDFKLLKILPSNLDDFNDIEELGDEIYFRTNENDENMVFPSVLVPTALTLSSETSSQASSSLPMTLSTSGYSHNLEIQDTKNDRFSNENRNDLSKFENITLIIREGEEYIVTFPKPRILDNFIVKESTTTTSFPTATITTADTSAPSFTVVPSINTAAATVATISTLPTEDSPVAASYVTSVENTTTTEQLFNRISARVEDDEQYIELVPTVGEAPNRELATTAEEFDNSNYDDDDDSFEDGYFSRRRQYSSVQRTYYGRPLPQGFTMTPGYPQFYIGDSECKWKILAPVSQKIRITILDISLRYDLVCRDYLKIIDLISELILFKSCTEFSSPIEIISNSNEVEVIVKTTTKFAFPKRGVLLHYSAFGCLTPPAPLHGRFVERTEHAVTFECQLHYVFPDTAVNRRQLVCTEQHIWDRSLPDCIEEEAVSGSGNISVFNFNSYKRPQSATSAKMGLREADTVFDIIIPTVLIVGLFAVNAVIFVIIMKHRKKSANQRDGEAKELAEL